jgi:hypothetical protein
MSSKATKIFIIGTFVTLYLLVSVISTIHVIDFFSMSNPPWLAISLAIAFEVGAAASLASIITLDKMNKGIVWALFILLTAMQAMGNTYYTYVHLKDFQGWIELFGLVEEELIYQKRVLSIVSGAILPIVALGFIKSLVDYIKPADTVNDTVNDIVGDPVNPQITDAVTQAIEIPSDDLFEDLEKIETFPASEQEVYETEPVVIEEDVITDEVEISPSQIEEIPTETQVDNKDIQMSIDDKIARGLTSHKSGILFSDVI